MRTQLVCSTSSTVIEDVLAHCQEDSKRAVAYFYFDFRVSEKQHYDNLIRSLLTQFSAQSPALPRVLDALYVRHHYGSCQPNTEQLVSTLIDVLDAFESSFIILDALDECRDRDDLMAFIKRMLDQTCRPGILVASRKEHDIQEHLEPWTTKVIPMEANFVNIDIHSYIQAELCHNSRLKKWPSQVKEHISDALMQRADGM